MQPSPTPAPSANTLAEIAAIVIAGLLIVGGVVLLFTRTVDLTGATTIFVLAVGILSVNVALKAPSPAQQQQIQAVVGRVLDVLPGLMAHAATPPQITIHNNLPPLPTVPAAPVQPTSFVDTSNRGPIIPLEKQVAPAVPVAAAAQPTPVQITPNPALTVPFMPPGTATQAATATWHVNTPANPLAPNVGGVPQVPFPERFTSNPPAVPGP